MAKGPSVLSFLCCIGAASEDIPVTVKEGPKTLGTEIGRASCRERV